MPHESVDGEGLAGHLGCLSKLWYLHAHAKANHCGSKTQRESLHAATKWRTMSCLPISHSTVCTTQDGEDQDRGQLEDIITAISQLQLSTAELARRQRLMTQILCLQEAHIADLHHDAVRLGLSVPEPLHPMPGSGHAHAVSC